MTGAMTILEQAKAAGVILWCEGETLRCRGDKAAVESLLPMLKAHKPDLLAALNLNTLLTEACHGVDGIDAATFRALLSPDDIEDIKGGHIPMVTLNAYAQSFAEGIRCGRITGCRQPPRINRGNLIRCAVPTAGTSSGTPSVTATG